MFVCVSTGSFGREVNIQFVVRDGQKVILIAVYYALATQGRCAQIIQNDWLKPMGYTPRIRNCSALDRPDYWKLKYA